MRMKTRLWCLGAVILASVAWAGCEAFNFPTVEDVNTLTAADHEFVAGLHDAGSELMTEQHGAMTPELTEAFAAMKGQYNDLAAQLASRASETKASGLSIGGLGGLGGNGVTGFIGGLLDMLGLGWIATLFLPSRATKKIAALELDLATAAKAGEMIPSDG